MGKKGKIGKIFLTDMNSQEAFDFFLESSNYLNVELPIYFNFSKILEALREFYLLDTNVLKLNKISEYENVNFKLVTNKDGAYSWRPFELVNPVVYVLLSRYITKEGNWECILKRLKKLEKCSRNIKCFSMPFKSYGEKSSKLYEEKRQSAEIKNWLTNIEQQSLVEALKYSYLVQSDISSFYSSIYTHSIPWALHSKRIAKKNKNNNKKNKKNKKKLLGNELDYYIRSMSMGETIGIPQGNVISDFIAEIILSYIDAILSVKIMCLGIKEFKILRYRDDYRIFANTKEDAKAILKILSEVLMVLGLSLNSSKTSNSDNIISNSIKKPKLEMITENMDLDTSKTLVNQLLFIHAYAEKHPNSGTIITFLNKLKKIIKIKCEYEKLFNKESNIYDKKDDFIKEIREIFFIKEHKDYLENVFKDLNKNINVQYAHYKELKEKTLVLISILTDIAYKNSKTYPLYIAILSKILTFTDNKVAIKKDIQKKFLSISNTIYLNLFLQRISLKDDGFNVNCVNNKILEYVYNIKNGKSAESIYNIEWIDNNKIKDLFKKYPIVDEEKIKELDEYMQDSETNVFENSIYFGITDDLLKFLEEYQNSLEE